MPLHPRVRVLAAALTTAVASSTIVTLAAPAQAASTSVVVSEVYGGGGNSGATYTHDFVELYNLGATPVDLSTFTVEYYSAGGTAPASTTALTGAIAPRTFYLIQMAPGTGGTTPLPAPDATGGARMSGTTGRVVLRDGAATVDGVAYGSSATPVEGTPAPGTSNTTSVSRPSPCTDTDDNAADFRTGQPSPRNAAAGSQACTPAPPPGQGQSATIAQIQGARHRSPLEGKQVSGVQGVVTAVGGQGYWMQSTTPDDDPATSEGLYVYSRSTPVVQAGDAVSVDGTVTEYRPGGSRGNDNLTTTQLVGPRTTVAGANRPVPAPVVIGVDRVAPPQTIEAGNPFSVEYEQAAFRPTVDAIDFYESLEGMRVAVRDAQVVGPTSRFGEIAVVPGRLPAGSAVRSLRGGVVYRGYDHPNAMRVQLDDALIPRGSMPVANVRDRIPGDTTGVLDYSFANFKLQVTAPPTVLSGGLQRERTRPAAKHELAIASFNVENLSPSDPVTKFSRLAAQVVNNLAAPDLLALEEIQDNSGPKDDGTVASDRTTGQLVDAITAAGGPRYQARWIDPQDKADGGQPGGNIRLAFLFRTDRGLTFVDRPGGDATTGTQVVKGRRGPALTLSPGRVDPTNPAWVDSRKPLAAEFRFAGRPVFVIANHFRSKGGDDPLFGRWQQPVRSSEPGRHAQAKVVRDFVDGLLAADARAKVVVLGDVNDFEFSRTSDILVGSGRTSLLDLPRTLPVGDRYTYVYQGNSQVLDHIFISRSLAGGRGRPPYSYDIVHTNSEFADQDSDHDPQVVRLALRGR